MKIEEMEVGKQYLAEEWGVVQYLQNGSMSDWVLCNWFDKGNKYNSEGLFITSELTEREQCPRVAESFKKKEWITEKEWEDMEKIEVVMFKIGDVVLDFYKNTTVITRIVNGRIWYKSTVRDKEVSISEEHVTFATEAHTHKYKVGDKVTKDGDKDYTVTKLKINSCVITYDLIDSKGEAHSTYEGLLQPTKTPVSEKLEFKVGDVVLDSKNAPTVILDVEEYNVWYITSIDSSRVYRAKESVNHATEADTHKYKIGDTVIGKHSGDQYVVHKLTVVNKLVSYWVEDHNRYFSNLQEYLCREDSYGDFAKEAAKPQNIPAGAVSTKSYLDEIRDLENQIKILEIDNEELENSRDHFKDIADRVKTEKEESERKYCELETKYLESDENWNTVYCDMARDYEKQIEDMDKTYAEEVKALKESRLFFQTLSDSYMTDNIAQTKVLVEAQKQAANWKSKSDQYESQLAINESKVDKPSLMKRVFG